MIEGLLKLLCEVVFGKGEVADERIDDQISNLSRNEIFLRLVEVFPLHNVLDDSGVGRGPTDAHLFGLLDETGFGKARRGFCTLVQYSSRLGREAQARLEDQNLSSALGLFAFFIGCVLGCQRTPAGIGHCSASGDKLERAGYLLDLQSAKPTGRIQSTGSFGPLLPNNLGATPVSGDFTFSPVNLGDIHGISGTLSATGRFYGALASIEADGTSDTPNFAVGRAGTPVSPPPPMAPSMASTLTSFSTLSRPTPVQPPSKLRAIS
jgi:hypothetical protein